MPFNQDAFFQEVYAIVREIPRGRVATYKQIATLAGFPRHARMVGRALKLVPPASGIPCHRVVNSAGRTAPAWDEQRRLLELEGVRFKTNGCVDMPGYVWQILAAGF